MTHHPIKTEPDGTRVYSRFQRYRPVPPEERKKGVRKPDDPRAVRFHGQWFLPLSVLPDEARVMPETRADSDAYDHMETNLTCRCLVCRRPQAERWRRKWRKDHGLKPDPRKKNRAVRPGS